MSKLVEIQQNLDDLESHINHMCITDDFDEVIKAKMWAKQSIENIYLLKKKMLFGMEIEDIESEVEK